MREAAALPRTTAWQLLEPKWQMARHPMRRHEKGDIRRMLVKRCARHRLGRQCGFEITPQHVVMS